MVRHSSLVAYNGSRGNTKTPASNSDPWGSFTSDEVAGVGSLTARLICPLSLFPLITETWSYLSEHISVFLLWIFISPRGSQLIRSECWMFQSSGIFLSLSPNLPSLPRHFYALCNMTENSAGSRTQSFPIVSRPISPSDTFLPFWHTSFQVKKWQPLLSSFNSCVSGFVTPRKTGTAKETHRDFLIL